MSLEKRDSLPITEQENPLTKELSSASTAQIVELMNQEDGLVAPAVGLVLDFVARAVDGIVERLKSGGRLFYIGTGTSGRLGVLDAAECPPTFGVSPELVQGIIAGGYEACYRAVEASEDDEEAGRIDLESRGFGRKDALVGIAASGRTPYTVGAISYARSLGALTVALTCVPDSPITKAAELNIVPVVGPEVLTGSTRLKAGTAQKMVLNMLSTATMIHLGYVSGNRMSNLQTRNLKLRDRAQRILQTELEIDATAALDILNQADGDLRVALVMAKAGATKTDAVTALGKSLWRVQEATSLLKSEGGREETHD